MAVGLSLLHGESLPAHKVSAGFLVAVSSKVLLTPISCPTDLSHPIQLRIGNYFGPQAFYFFKPNSWFPGRAHK